ncbi:carbohydrate ABC transporter permease [Paenibacillus sp. IB182496]|uniref:Carbohydrate ABC transporter permease n=1 Tax=Paenibacillus sabuli TaxID=2772509 RepID=A0A927GTD9_9BACL|nr:carbohydrate ABC transporter permease [Paenibacillus sabuli]MBD2847246.1 carbohydrate ABC transporter permease [Paenibacillus sabuli]
MFTRTWGERLFDWFNFLFLLLLGLCTLYPFIYVLTLSLMTPADALAMRVNFIPDNPTLASYEKVFAHPYLWQAYFNTIVRTVLGVSLMLLMTSLVAYPLSRRGFSHRGGIMKLLVFSMLFNGGMIPMYLLVKNLGLLNSVWALVLPGAVTAFNVIIMKNFFEGIPGEIIEAARIDGAGELRIYARIILPLSVPVLAVIALWGAVTHWNAWFDAMLYMHDSDKQVLQLFVRRTVIEEAVSLTPGEELNREAYTPETLKAATIMIVSLPILMVYPFVQRFFVKGVLLGSLKG